MFADNGDASAGASVPGIPDAPASSLQSDALAPAPTHPGAYNAGALNANRPVDVPVGSAAPAAASRSLSPSPTAAIPTGVTRKYWWVLLLLVACAIAYYAYTHKKPAT